MTRGTKRVTVDACSKWNRTGVTIAPGDFAEVEVVHGSWNCNPSHGTYRGEGHPTIAKPGYAKPGVNEGALIGKVGDEVFFIGDKGRVAVSPGKPASELLLCCNDDVDGKYGRGYADNWGELHVNVIY